MNTVTRKRRSMIIAGVLLAVMLVVLYVGINNISNVQHTMINIPEFVYTIVAIMPVALIAFFDLCIIINAIYSSD